jgi:streptogramin lyase
MISADKYSVVFREIPPPTVATTKNLFPFAPNTDEHVILLYSQNSQSAPYQLPRNRWSHLLPQWRFEDLDGNAIDKITTTDTVVTDASGGVIGVTGFAEFYYIDDLPTSELPVLLWGTLETSGIPVDLDDKPNVPGYGNSKVITVTPYNVNAIIPNRLEISSNGKGGIIESPKFCGAQTPFVITVNGDNIINELCAGAGEGSLIAFDYPQAAYSPSNIINKTLSSIDCEFQSTDYSFTNPNQQFVRKDENDFHIGGFVRDFVTSDVSCLNAFISASHDYTLDNIFHSTPFVWISNPENGTLNKVTFNEIDPGAIIEGVPVSACFTGVSVVTSTNNAFGVPIVESVATDNPMGLTGFGGIYGIAQDPCYDVWVTDSELDALYKFDTGGSLISTVQLSATFGDGITPAGISLDSELNMWVTLFDSISTLKFDRDANLLFVTAPTGNVGGLGDDPDYKPTQVETDTLDNAWVAYNNPESSTIIKYDPSGNQIDSIAVDLSATPVDMIIDPGDNSLWVTEPNSHIALLGKVKKYDSVGTELASFDFPHPGYITLDPDENVWFTYGFNRVGFISNDLGTTGSFAVSSENIIPGWYDETERLDFQALEGIASDSKDRIWIINSLENRVYIVSGGSFAGAPTVTPSFDTFKIQPDDNLIWYNDSTSQYSVSSEFAKSAQAYGDWIGFRWLQKYFLNVTSTGLVSGTISGMSNFFDITCKPDEIRRFNESFDIAQQMRDYALPEHIKKNENLFEGLFKGSLDSDQCNHQSIGRTFFEKIANFVGNHRDVDCSNIEQIYSLAEEIDVPIDDYNFEFPSELRRIMDIASLPHHKMRGARCKCNVNFSRSYNCDNCGDRHANNLGELFSPLTYIVTAGVPFVVEQLSLPGSYDLINTVEHPTTMATTYPLSSLGTISFLTSADYSSGRYCFFDYIPGTCNELVEGCINWDDEYTTLSETQSSLDEWYGNGGIIETMINYELHRGLDLLGDSNG